MTRIGAWQTEMAVAETAVEEMTTETVRITKREEEAAVEAEPASNAMRKATSLENARTLTSSMMVVAEAEVEEEEAVVVAVAVSATSATKKVTLPENVQMIQMVAVTAWIEDLTSDRGETKKVAQRMATGQVMVVPTGTRTRVVIRRMVGANETE